MKTTRLLKAELLILLVVVVLWTADWKTHCVPRAAAGALRQVVKVAPNSARAYDLLGDVYYSYGQRDRGDNACQKVVQAHPDDPNAHYNLAMAYSYADEPEQAIGSFEQVIRLDPSDAGAFRAMGYVYLYDVNDPEAAVDCYERATRIAPTDVWGWIDLGAAYIDNEQHENAIDAYEEAIRLDQNESHAIGCLAYGYLNLGISYDKAGQEDEAQASFRKAMEVFPHIANELFCWGNLFSREQNWKQAINRYQLSLKLSPDNPEAHCNLGRAYVEVGEKDLALQQYEMLKELDAESAKKLQTLLVEEGR